MSREIMINELEYCITTKLLFPVLHTKKKLFFGVFSTVYLILCGIEASINGNVDFFLRIISMVYFKTDEFEYTFELIIEYVDTD